MPPAKIVDIETIFGNVLRAFLYFAGFILFIMLVIGGFKYITSGGDPKAIEGAQKTITYALAGILIMMLAYLVLVIIGEFTGVDLTKFSIQI